MEKRASWLEQVGEDKRLAGAVTLLAVCSAASAGVELSSRYLPGNYFFVLMVLVAGLSGMLAVLKLRSIWKENQAYAFLVYELHQINHCYRNELHNYFWNNCHNNLPSQSVVTWEHQVLSGICQRIARIFGRFIGAPCVVTVLTLIHE